MIPFRGGCIQGLQPDQPERRSWCRISGGAVGFVQPPDLKRVWWPVWRIVTWSPGRGRIRCNSLKRAEYRGCALKGNRGACGTIFRQQDPSVVNGRVPNRDLFGDFEAVSFLSALPLGDVEAQVSR